MSTTSVGWPRALKPDRDGIPHHLKDQLRWLVWCYVPVENKRGDVNFTKEPYRSLSPGDHASSTDPATWSSFEDAWSAYRYLPNKLDGLGIVFSDDDPLLGIDLDHCIGDDGELEPWAERIVDGMKSYTELTPSGRGVRIICEVRKPPGESHKKTGFGPEKKGVVEWYYSKRFFACTGRPLPGYNLEIDHRDEEVRAFYAEWFPEKQKPGRKAKPGKSALPDERVLAVLRDARNGRRFADLYFDGDLSSVNGDWSAADFRLACRLLWGTAHDVGQADRLFRGSALMRDKWDERRGDTTYGERTLANALAKMGPNDRYTPPWTPKPGERLVVPDPGQPSANGDGQAHHEGNGNSDEHPPHEGNGRQQAEAPELPNEAVGDPHRLARIYRDERCSHRDGLTLRYWQGEFQSWQDGAYRPVTGKELRARVGGVIKSEFDRANIVAIRLWEKAGRQDEKGKPCPKPTARPVTETVKTDTLGNLASLTLIGADEARRQPAWLDGPGPWPADEILPTKNALVHLPSFAAGRPATMRPTPRFFSPYSLGYDFDPKAPEPTNWLTFLGSRPIEPGGDVQHQLWPDDPQSIETLQEWMGLNLVPDTRYQKILGLIGPRRCGKGTIARVKTALVGPENVANPTLASLAQNFGLAPLIGKLSAIISDARISGRTDIAQVVESLLSISGEDNKTIDRKHQPSWTGRIIARFTIISNELPRLAEQSGALAGRMILLRMTRSFYGQEDLGLMEKLLPELPGILLWAIEGWRRLQERGHFAQPESGKPLVEEMEELSSPIGMFVKECCVIAPDEKTPVPDVFARWKTWCQEKNRLDVGDESAFGRNLRSVLPDLVTRPVKKSGKYYRVFEGIGLTIDF